MKFATPLTVALFVTSRIGSEADAAGTTGDGLVNSAVGWNEKEHYPTSTFPVSRRLQALQIFKNNNDQSLCMNWDHESGFSVSLQTCDGSPAQSWYVDALNRIHSSVDDTKCLKASVSSVLEDFYGGASVAACDESLNQQWVNDGSDRLQDQQYKFFLGVDAGCGGVEAGRRVQVQKLEYGGGNCLSQQQWIAAPAPTPAPTNQPTPEPSHSPTNPPTANPSKAPSPGPTDQPTPGPSHSPTKSPTANPSKAPSPGPTNLPTPGPSHSPTKSPTANPSKAPSPGPTDQPTPGPSHSPTKSPTANPSKAPSPGPTNLPTPGPSHSPTKSPTANPSKAPSPGPTNLPTPGPSHSPTNSPTPAIDSWDLELTSVDSNFTIGSQSEFTVTYKIGAGRKFEFSVLKKGCKEAVDTAVITLTNSTSPNEDDPSLENLSVFLDVEKDSIVDSNIWDSVNQIVEFCVRVELLSSITEIGIKKLERDFGIELLFDTSFETVDDAQFGQIFLESNQTDAQVDKYIEACTCDSKESFECNQNVLGPDEFLNVCIRSLDDEMEINYLDSLKMTQEDLTLNIVQEKDLVDSSISSKSKVALKNGVHVASVIPASFFSYDKPSTAQVSGVVFLKLAGSRRRLAVEIDDFASPAMTRGRALQLSAGDQESTFAMEVQLERNELDSNGAISAVMTCFAGVTAAVVTAAFIAIW